MTQQRPNVVFTFVEAGMGHIVPATAMADAFEHKYGDRCNVIRYNIFSGSASEDVVRYGKSLSNDTRKMANHKVYAVLEYAMSALIGNKGTLRFTDRLCKKARPHVIRELAALKPDFVMSTYFSPSRISVLGRRAGSLDCLIGTYTPDPIVYPAWDKTGDVYITNNRQATEQATAAGFNNVVQVPFVLRKQVFEAGDDKREARRKLGLPEDKFTILLADGAYGQKNLVKFTVELLKADLPVTVISVCGKNQQAYDKLTSLKVDCHNTTFVPLGFTDKMILYNSAADLFVGKGGANSIVESLYFGVPVIVSAYANMLEKRTAHYYIDKLGCGRIIRNKRKFIRFVKDVLDDPSLLEPCREAAKVFHDPTGAEKAADIIFDMVAKRCPFVKD